MRTTLNLPDAHPGIVMAIHTFGVCVCRDEPAGFFQCGAGSVDGTGALRWREGRTTGEADLHIAPVSQPAGQHAFLVVNASRAARRFSVELSRSLSVPLARFTYGPATIRPTPEAVLLGSDGEVQPADTWTDTIPARGVRLDQTSPKCYQVPAKVL